MDYKPSFFNRRVGEVTFDTIQDRTDFFLSRRDLLRGAGAVIGSIFMSGVSGAIVKDRSLDEGAITSSTEAPVCYSSCLHEEPLPVAEVPAAPKEILYESVQQVVLPLAPVEAQAVAKVQPPPVQLASEDTTPGFVADRLEELNCNLKLFSSGECVAPARTPGEVPFKRFDTDRPEEVEQIQALLGAVALSPERYQNFKINTAHSYDLAGMLSRTPIWPSISINHWVGYEDLAETVQENIDRMRQGRLSYHNLVLANGSTHLIAPSPHDLVGHAKWANYDSMGTSANANSLATLTPEMLEAMIYTELWGDKEYGRVMTRENSRSHAEVVRHDAITKVDWPSQLQDGFFKLKLALNHVVYVEGVGGHPAPFTA